MADHGEALTTFILVPALADAVKIPVIAAGGVGLGMENSPPDGLSGQSLQGDPSRHGGRGYNGGVLPVGQVAGLIKDEPTVAEVIERMIAEAQDVQKKLTEKVA